MGRRRHRRSSTANGELFSRSAEVNNRIYVEALCLDKNKSATVGDSKPHWRRHTPAPRRVTEQSADATTTRRVENGPLSAAAPKTKSRRRRSSESMRDSASGAHGSSSTGAGTHVG